MVHGPFIFFKKKKRKKRKGRMKTQDKTKQNGFPYNKYLFSDTRNFTPDRQFFCSHSHRVGSKLAPEACFIIRNWENPRDIEPNRWLWLHEKIADLVRNCWYVLMNKTKQTFKKIVRVLMYMNSIKIIIIFFEKYQNKKKNRTFFRLEFLKLLRCVMPIIKHLC